MIVPTGRTRRSGRPTSRAAHTLGFEAYSAPGATGTRLDDWYDDLTRLPGAAFWQTVVAAESARSVRFHRQATVVLVEAVRIDELLAQWGRSVALRSVVEIGRILRDGCRASDYVMRLGEGRFGILLTETDEIAAINVVERLRGRCEAALAALPNATGIAFGWASPTEGRALVDTIEKAEHRLRHEMDSAAS